MLEGVAKNIGLVMAFAISFIAVLVVGAWLISSPAIEETNEQFGGNVTQEISVVYDRDTGVYYALTEGGGLNPLYNADGSLKLVDGGDPS